MGKDRIFKKLRRALRLPSLTKQEKRDLVSLAGKDRAYVVRKVCRAASSVKAG